MIFSKFQTAIYDFMENNEGSLQIDAVAGSGKSTTIVEGAKKVKGQGKFLAFNRKIADALKGRLPSNIPASTINGLGWQICLAQKSVKLDADKTFNILKTFVDPRQDSKKYWKFRGPMKRLVSLFKGHLVEEVDYKLMTDFATKFDIELPEQENEFFDALVKVYAKSIAQTTIMDFDDQICMPIFYDWPIHRHDFIMLDEAQDVNPANIELILRSCTRLISVGDPFQSIYGFRGADINAMPKLREASNAQTLPLSICYRCAKSIVRYAQGFVPHIEYNEESPEGVVDDVKKDQFWSAAQNGDFVLCRINAPLVSACLRFIRDGKKATVQGRDIAESLVQLMEKLAPDSRTPTAEFFNTLKAYEQKEIDRLMRAEREEQVELLQDRIAVLVEILQVSETTGDMANRIRSIFTDTVGDGIILSSSHRSKGLEADRVYVLEPGKLGKPAKTPEATQQEKNLFYVTVTRAKKELFWVKP